MKKKFFALFLTVVLTVCTVCGCGLVKKTSGKAGTKVVLNEVAHSIFYAPMYVAIEEGYFAEEGIDLELVTGFGECVTVQKCPPQNETGFSLL